MFWTVILWWFCSMPLLMVYVLHFWWFINIMWWIGKFISHISLLFGVWMWYTLNKDPINCVIGLLRSTYYNSHLLFRALRLGEAMHNLRISRVGLRLSMSRSGEMVKWQIDICFDIYGINVSPSLLHHHFLWKVFP